MKIKQSGFGDLYSYEVTHNGKPITDAVVTLQIFQNLLSPVWNVQIEILDTVNRAAKFKAGDKFGIMLETKQGFDTDGKYNFDCFLYEIVNRTQHSQNTVSLIVKCATHGFRENHVEKVKKVFKNKSQDKIVKEIVQDSLHATVGDKPPKPAQHEPHTPYKQKDGSRQPSKAEDDIVYLGSNVAPFDAIAYMLKSAKMDGKADFVFFTKDAQSRKFDFASLSNMFRRKPVAKFVQRPNAILEKGDYRLNKNLEFTFFVFDHFDDIGNAASGFKGNTVFTFDMTSKKFESKPKGKQKDACYGFEPVHKEYIDAGPGMHEQAKDWWPSRRQDLFKAEQNKLKIQTFGHAKAFGWLAETVEVDVPANNSLDEQARLDDKYKGKYMVSAVMHYITSEKYYCNFELVNGWSK
jgi:hypothetical protein|nr:MAG TPA: Baseplate wedge protein [Caudoviricetes sp.]